MNISEIGNIIIQTNEKYALSLNKDIQFILNINGYFPHLHVYKILSLINNLVSNSVESIKDKGIIKISIYKSEDIVCFQVYDNGVGIPEKKRELIFKPGYTTKYDIYGKSSTGMGLSYIRQVIKNLKGSVTVKYEPTENETIFTIELPLNSLIEKGW